MSIRQRIDSARISRFQLLVIGICLVISLADGFDILVMAFTVSDVAKEWSLTGTQVGLLLSSGLVGIGLGSLFIAPLADRFGRRPITLICLLTAAVGMALSSLTSGFVQLGLCRVVTGLGIGGLVAALPVILTEYTPQRRRGTAIGLSAIGLPLGGVVGGTVAALITDTWGWRATFLIGAVLPLLMLATAYRAIPESLEYLLVRRPPNALDAINRLLRKMALDPVAAMPDPEASGPGRHGGRAEIFSGRNGFQTTLLWIAFFVVMAGLYFASSWTPRLLEQSGLSATQGIGGGVLLNLGGVVGLLLFSALALAVSTRTLTVLSFVGAALAFGAVSISLGNLPATLVAALAVGVFANTAVGGLFAVAPGLYSPAVRTTAVGLAAAVGRIGAIVSPLVVGLFVDLSWSASGLFAVFAIPMVIGAVAMGVLTWAPRRTEPAVADETVPRSV